MSSLVTVKEVAEILGLSYQGADYLIRAHGLRAAEVIGITRRYRRSDIERLRGKRRPVGRPRMR